YSDGIPITIINNLYREQHPSLPYTTTAVVTEDCCGGILKMIALAYPSGREKLRVLAFGVVINLQELRSHAGVRGTIYQLTFVYGRMVVCDNGLLGQGFISAEQALSLEWRQYLANIRHRQGRLCD